jgi:hypothetical protein
MARGRFVNRPYDIVMTSATAIHHCINIKHARKNPGVFVILESVIIRNMLHDVFHAAFQNIAQSVNGVDLYVAVMAQTVELCTVYIVTRIQIVLRHTFFLHRFPESVVLYHAHTAFALDFFSLSP